MANLISTIQNCFSNIPNKNFQKGTSYEDTNGCPIMMTVPINKDSFEIPLFLMSNATRNLLESYDHKPGEAFVYRLFSTGLMSYYRSLDAKVRHNISVLNGDNSLMYITEDLDRGKKYYGTYGAIFDEKYNPLMMLLWEVKKVYSTDFPVGFKYQIVRPIMRIAPDVMRNKGNAMERYIANKMVAAILSLNYYYSHGINNGMWMYPVTPLRTRAKIIVDDFPFERTATEIPSASTSNEELLGIANNHLDDLMLCQ